MQFTKRLRAPIKHGEITTSVRIWQKPRVKVGGSYKLDEGHVTIDRVNEITLADITPTIARTSGFASVAELLRVAKHGAGERVFLIEFHYQPPS